jgi:hypothetical protein
VSRRQSRSTEVVTLVRGREEHLRNQVLGLIAGQRWPVGLVVVVMGGPDPTRALPPTPFPIRTFWCEPDDGRLPLARARNAGVAAVRTPNAVLLDVDCIPGAQLVAAYEDVLAGDDVVAMGHVRYLDPGATDGGWSESELVARSAGHAERVPPALAGPTDDHERFWSLSFAVRTDTFDQLGGFDDGYVGYGAEDTDLAFTIRDAQVPLWWVPQAVAYHQHHVTYDPPVQHLRDIVANARRFRTKWGVWPMGGWLETFADHGLVRWDAAGTELAVLRDPSETELALARRPAATG